MTTSSAPPVLGLGGSRGECVEAEASKVSPDCPSCLDHPYSSPGFSRCLGTDLIITLSVPARVNGGATLASVTIWLHQLWGRGQGSGHLRAHGLFPTSLQPEDAIGFAAVGFHRESSSQGCPVRLCSLQRPACSLGLLARKCLAKNVLLEAFRGQGEL